MNKFHKINNLLSLINISDCILSDIKSDKNISLFDIENLNDKLSFKDSKKLNKAYYTNDLLSLEYALYEIKLYALKKIKAYYNISG